jgi:L-asparagine transporter-like permease
MFVWQIVFISHLRFRGRWFSEGNVISVRMIGYPYTSILGFVLVTAIIATTWWIARMRITIFSGLGWLAAITLGYWFWERRQRSSTNPVGSAKAES